MPIQILCLFFNQVFFYLLNCESSLIIIIAGLELLYNIALASTVQQSKSDICKHIYSPS